MTQIIFNTYEIIEHIGSGGGGNVYLAKHLRLGKLVVLKADKRTLKTKPESLRREVDALKNLSHMYIPQVYDFFVENGTVYTVMDYIEGESLDKPLKRGERFEQSEVLKWTDQLLQAVVYLHERPPHGILHSDIKPANVMLTPQGDIRLIDFNIALALGEEGAVRVGFSRGYASPEHYGIDYTAAGDTRLGADASTRVPEIGAVTMLPGQNVPSYEVSGSDGSYGSSKRSVLLDVRSDIYSLGATVYHLLTGVRPDPEAKNVKPISTLGVSPAVARIISRAMAPNPDERYQTAQEMLDDLRALHDRDPRAVRHRRRIRITAAALVCVFLAGGAMTFAGLRVMQKAEQAARIAEEEARLAEEEARLVAERAEEEERSRRQEEEKAKRALELVTSSETALKGGDRPGAVRDAVEAFKLDTQYNGRAQLALTEALGVYDMYPGFTSQLRLELTEQPSKLALTNDGRRMAVLSGGTVTVFDTSTGDVQARLPATTSAMGDVVFSGPNTLIYAGAEGICCYDVAENAEKWCAEPSTAIALSEDGATIAAVNKDEPRVRIYSVADGSLQDTVELGKSQRVLANDVYIDPEDELLTLSADGTMLAVSASGDMVVYDLADRSKDITVFEGSEFDHFEGGFFGKYLAFAASGGGENIFAVIDTRNASTTGGFSSKNPFHVQADGSGIYLSNQNVLVSIDPETGEQREVAYTEKYIDRFAVRGGYAAVATEDGTLSFYGPEANLLAIHKDTGADDLLDVEAAAAVAAGYDTSWVRVFAFDGKQESVIFSYPSGTQHSEARLNVDGGTVMLFRYDGFLLFSIDGELINETKLSEPDEIYDQQYRRDEKGGYLEVFYNDGHVMAYSAIDGALMDEYDIEPHDKTLDQEFVTSRYRVTAPLHGAAVFYDISSGEELYRLEEDAYVAYVYESGEYIIADMMDAEGGRYGLLLDGDFNAIARMPGICDVPGDGTVIFDDQMGTLRRCRIYAPKELLTMAKNNYQEEDAK